jgi:hypothetical protein
MLPPIVDITSLQPDAKRTAPVVPPQPPQPPQPVQEPARADSGADGLVRLAGRAQELMQGTEAPFDALLDPARRHGPTTSEMLALQTAVSNYTITLLTISHLAQSAGSAIQSLTQRT